MFDFPASPSPLRADLRAAIEASWSALGKPGTWWSAGDRVGIASVARAARSHDDIPETGLPAAAVEAATRLASEPATTSGAWVDGVVSEIGEEQYVELLGVTTRTVAVDTLSRLLGGPLESLPDPEPGDPTREEADPKPVRTRFSWVNVGEILVPPFTLSLVPDEATTTNHLAWALYMTDAEMDDPDFRRGDLHRTQIELVATTVSYGNECFY